MLIQFKVGNVLSFSNPVIFSMVGTNAVKEFENINSFIDPTKKFKLLKSAAIYGANASGKSNLIKSISVMKSFVLNSFRDALLEKNERILKVTKFLLKREFEREPSIFEMVFIYKNKRYRYGFEVNEGLIEREWLFFVNTNKEIKLFVREKKGIQVNKRSFHEGVGLEEKTRNNVLFLTVVAQLNGERSSKVVEWFKKLRIVSGLNDLGHKDYTLSKYKSDKNFKNWAKSIFDSLDIIDLSTEKELPPTLDINSIPKQEKNRKAIETLFSALKELQDQKGEIDRIVTWHNKYDSNNAIIEKIPFDFNTQESEGTKKIINFLGPIYDTLSNGYVLIVDELDSRLHPLLTVMIISFFQQHNLNNAQLVFASHDTNLLKKEYFRRDQIWFTEKNEFGETDLYSLIEYKEVHVRNDAAFDKNYLNGRYGAIPFLDNVVTGFD
ncbi:MAG: ATP-binding protein [Desulfobacula sp.]|jgi:hypothetical protein